MLSSRANSGLQPRSREGLRGEMFHSALWPGRWVRVLPVAPSQMMARVCGRESERR